MVLHCFASNSRNCRISCGYLRTNRELTNEEKCQWRKLCHVLLYNTAACWRDITSLTDCSEVHMGFYYCSASQTEDETCINTHWRALTSYFWMSNLWQMMHWLYNQGQIWRSTTPTFVISYLIAINIWNDCPGVCTHNPTTSKTA